MFVQGESQKAYPMFIYIGLYEFNESYMFKCEFSVSTIYLIFSVKLI